MKRNLIWGSATLGAFIMLLACLGATLPAEIAFRTVLGWSFFLVAVAPEMRIDWPNVAFGASLFVAFAIGLHWFLRWFYFAQQTAPREGAKGLESQAVPTPAAAWSWKWTTAIALLVLLMFVAGISMVGITHQVTWLITSEEPLVDYLNAARRSESKNKLKQQVLGFQNHANNSKGELVGGATSDGRGQLLHGWQTALLPYLEQQALYDKIDRQRPWNLPPNAELMKTQLQVYRNPGNSLQERTNAEGYAFSHYAGNSHVLATDRPWKFDDVTDGTANTILTGEAAGNFRPWGSPTNWRDPTLGIGTSPAGFGGPWRNEGANFSMCDGSVISLSKDTDPRVLRALATPRGGEDATLP